MSIENPIIQHFRRPAVYFVLPSGHQYPPEVVTYTENGDLPVYPMTAIDEITSKTPDALYNGHTVPELIKSCIPNIRKPWELLSIDADAALIAIRTASGSGEQTIESECPDCKEMNNYTIDLMHVMRQLKLPDYSDVLRIGQNEIKFRPLTYQEANAAAIANVEIAQITKKLAMDAARIQEQSTDVTEANVAINTMYREASIKFTKTVMEHLSNAIEYIKVITPDGEMVVNDERVVLDTIQQAGADAYRQIREYHSKLVEQSKLKPLTVGCSCGHQYEQPYVLNLSDFFGQGS